MKTITIKKNSKMKTIKLNKNGKARQPRKMKRDTKAEQIAKIVDHVKWICAYAKDNLCTEFIDDFQFEELEEMLWKLAR